MKLNIELDNLETLVKETLVENSENVIKQEVDNTVKILVKDKIRGIIDEIVNEKMVNFVENYIKTTEIKIGGGLYSKIPEEVYTVEEFIRKSIADTLSENSLKIKNDSRYGDGYDKVTFEEYIKRMFNVEALVKKELESFIKTTKQDINNRISNTFTDVTKAMLSDTVYSVLMANETFQKLNDNIKCIADR